MTRFSIRAALLMVLGAALAAGAVAQVQTGKPITIKQPKVKKIEKFKGEVLAATNIQIIVRSQTDANIVKTFSFTPELREKMIKIIDEGGYQAGDKVEIQHAPNSNVAVKIKGKPSKPR